MDFQNHRPNWALFKAHPLVKVFTQAQLEESLIGTGFKIDYAWLPKKNAATCIVAIKQN